MPRILLVHAMLSRAVPEMAITEPDALELAKAYVGWRKHYGEMADPKTAALMTLIFAALMIYGPRLMRVQARIRAGRAADQSHADAAASGSTIVQMPGLRG